MNGVAFFVGAAILKRLGEMRKLAKASFMFRKALTGGKEVGVQLTLASKPSRGRRFDGKLTNKVCMMATAGLREWWCLQAAVVGEEMV
jgi:hypothetical protein